MILFPFILSLCLFVSLQPTHTVARRSNYCQVLFTARRETHKLRIFWSTSFFFPLFANRPVVANFLEAKSSFEEFNNLFTSVSWYGANVRTLYLHTQGFSSDLLFWLFNKQFDSERACVAFSSQAALHRFYLKQATRLTRHFLKCPILSNSCT